MFKYAVITILSAMLLMAEGISWEKDFKSGVENAKKLAKPLFFVSSRHSCKYCVMLEEKTFTNKDVIEKLNKDFVSVIAYSDENDYMPPELWRPGVPALWFLHPNGTPIFEPLMGAVDAKNFMKALHIVKTEFDKSSKK